MEVFLEFHSDGAFRSVSFCQGAAHYREDSHYKAMVRSIRRPHLNGLESQSTLKVDEEPRQQAGDQAETICSKT